MKQYMQIYGEDDPELDEDDLDGIVEEFRKLNIYPVAIYRGSIIFYERSYGHFYLQDFDASFQGEPPCVVVRDHIVDRTKMFELAKQKGGTITFLFGSKTECICFPTLRQVENFVAELWSIK